LAQARKEPVSKRKQSYESLNRLVRGSPHKEKAAKIDIDTRKSAMRCARRRL